MPAFLKIIGVGLLISLIGFFLVQRDIRLRIWGARAQGSIEGAWVKEGGILDSSGKQVTKIEYTFRDANNNLCHGSFIPSSSWRPAEDLSVKVVYLTSDPTINRFEDQGAFGSYALFMVGLLLLALGVWMFFKESVTDSHKSETPINAKGKVGRIMDKLTD